LTLFSTKEKNAIRLREPWQEQELRYERPKTKGTGEKDREAQSAR
jgi:hypothetical protein